MVYSNITEVIGKTPMMRLSNIEDSEGAHAALYGKLEAVNPAGSIKDRAALFMIKDAEAKGLLKPGSTIIEATSGNTGIGLAEVCASRGYRTIIIMPESMSIERRNLLKAFGAELVLTEASKGMQGTIDKMEELKKEMPKAFVPGQFVNPANAEAHFETTAPEIWEDLKGEVDYIIAGIGTGGTITGIGRYMKEKRPNIKIIGVEPANSPLLSQGKSGKHNLQGIGANFVPDILDTKVMDEIVTVKEDDAYRLGRKLATEEGYLAGITSGAALWAGVQLAKQPENKGKNIVVILPDSGERYLTTEMFD